MRTPTRAGIATITIDQQGNMTLADFKKSLSWANQDQVKWVNKSNTPRVISFVSLWPFLGLQATIYVPQRDKGNPGESDVFQVDLSKPKNTTYFYTISPQVTGPPDGPAVIVNGG